MGSRFKRLLAFVIDWNITIAPFAALFYLAFAIFTSKNEFDRTSIILLFILSFFGGILLFLKIFVLRDVLFKGRSLGKRILGLQVYDKKTLNPATVRQCFIRNLFFFLYEIDAIVMLVTGESIGDRVAGTLVVSEQGLENYKHELNKEKAKSYDPYSPMKKGGLTKIVIVIVAIVVICILAFFGLIKLILDAQKDTEQYKAAYHYLVESQAFAELNVDESKIHFNQYELNSYKEAGETEYTHTAQLGFIVKFRSFVVVCHKENGEWVVCDECTSFK